MTDEAKEKVCQEIFVASMGKRADTMKSPYDILGVPNDADDAAVKKAFNRQARKHHPDRGGDPEKFKEVQRAFKVLSDPLLRAEFDATGVWLDEKAKSNVAEVLRGAVMTVVMKSEERAEQYPGASPALLETVLSWDNIRVELNIAEGDASKARQKLENRKRTFERARRETRNGHLLGALAGLIAQTDAGLKQLADHVEAIREARRLLDDDDSKRLTDKLSEQDREWVNEQAIKSCNYFSGGIGQ